MPRIENISKIYLIAGESSGDLHGSNLIKGLLKENQHLNFRAIGGDKMEMAGASLFKHIRETNFMGFVEIVKHLPKIFRLLKDVKNDILAFQPDLLILIDYPGFNMRMAKFAFQHNIPVFYYISPQVWAWKAGRVHHLKKYVSQMFVILPFEVDFYQKYNWKVHYSGHPLLDVISDFEHEYSIDKKLLLKPFINSQNVEDLLNRPIISLLPGSRLQEIKRMLPIMVEVAFKFKDYLFVIAQAPNAPNSWYESILNRYNDRNWQDNILLIPYAPNQSYKLIKNSVAALVTSGTATLETALLNTPQIVCYKGDWISYQIAIRIISLKYISLVNLILDQPAVLELIQNQLTPQILEESLRNLLKDENLKKTQEKYQELFQILKSNESQITKISDLIAKKMGSLLEKNRVGD